MLPSFGNMPENLVLLFTHNMLFFLDLNQTIIIFKIIITIRLLQVARKFRKKEAQDYLTFSRFYYKVGGQMSKIHIVELVF